jgi:hypothetical protein
MFFAFVYNAAGIPIAAGILYPSALADHWRRCHGTLVGECCRECFAFARHSSLTGAQVGGSHQPVHICSCSCSKIDHLLAEVGR